MVKSSKKKLARKRSVEEESRVDRINLEALSDDELKQFDDEKGYENISEDADDYDLEEEFLTGGGVLGLADEDDEDEMEDEMEDEHDEDEDEDEMEDEEDQNESEEDSRFWGSRKGAYYAADSDPEDAEDEEKEALAIQKKRLSALEQLEQQDEFGNILLKAPPNSSDGEQEEQEADSDDENSDKDDDFQLSEDEKIERDLGSLTPEEIREILRNQSPELFDLIADFKDKMGIVKDFLGPLVTKAKEQNWSQTKGLGFLECKYQVLLNYCTNIAYYLLLKSNGKSVKNHPVIDQLVTLRVYMEKMKPLEAKLSGQIEKYVKAAASIETNNDQKDPMLLSENISDPLAFRPNPDSLVMAKADKHGGKFQDDVDDDESVAIYKAPRFAPVHYEDVDKRRKSGTNDLKKTSKRLLHELTREFSEKPEEIKDNEDEVYDQELEKVKEKLAYEEENLTRLQLTKKELAKLKGKRKQRSNELDMLDDFGDLNVLEQTAAEQENLVNRIRSKKQTLAKHISHVEKAEKVRKSRHDGGDDEYAVRPKKKFRSDEKRSQNGVEADQSQSQGQGHGQGQELEDEYYKSVKTIKKQLSESAKAEKAALYKFGLDDHYDDDEELDDGAKRPASLKILKNRGLTPHRKKENKNPRVKRRMKFETAKKKLKSVRAVYQGGQGADRYGGEKSGIKSHLTKSVKFNN